jgi:WD40 repeat protein
MRILQEAVVQYSTCVNHASISPDGQTLLSVGDEPEVYLHSLSSLSPPTPLHSTVTASLRSNASPPYGLIYSTSDFGYSPSEIRFSMSASKHITMRAPKPILTIPTALCDSEMTGRTRELVSCAPRSLNTQALFSTAWSGDGWKFAAGSQDGIVQVCILSQWDDAS